MKKAVSYVIIFLLLIFVYQFIVIYFENSHEVNYEIATKDKSFTINEAYEKKANNDGYLLTITSDDNREYVFYANNQYNKQKKIIKEIKYYEKDDYLCIYPIDYKNKNDFEILCNDGKKLYSYYYVNNQVDISDFVNELNLSYYYKQNLESEIKENDIVFYKDNYYDNEYLELYRYKYLYVLNKGDLNSISFSSTDIYSNKLGTYINNYFLVPVVNNNKMIDNYYVIDCKTKETKTIHFGNPLSNNIYIIGVLDDKLYIFDINNKTEYKIDPKGKYEEIGNTEKGFKIYENGEWKKESVTEFVTNKITFNQDINPDLKYKYDEIYESDREYYIVENNNLYKIYKDNLDIRILLLNVEGKSNIRIENNRIYYISGEYLYRYDQYGIKTLVKNNEFKYNTTNIYNVYND